MNSTSNKIIISVCIAATLFLLAYGFPIIKDRYFTEPEITSSTVSDSADLPPDTVLINLDSEISSPSEDQTTNEDSDESDADIEEENDTFLDISKSDCDNKCSAYKDADDLKYCQQVCGIAPITKNDDKKLEGCEALEDDLEIDYCFKDLAINKNDITFCNEIIDSNIRKTCANRLTEDLIDAQGKK